MAIEVKMPALSPTMDSGKLVEWKFTENAKINSGDVLFTVETDKAIMEFEVAYEGTLAKILIGDNTSDVQVGTTVGWILEHADDVIPDDVMPVSEKPQTDESGFVHHQDNVRDFPTKMEQKVVGHKADVQYGKNRTSTPAARARAHALGVDIDDVIGYFGGKVREEDVIAFKEKMNTPISASAKTTQSMHNSSHNSSHNAPVIVSDNAHKTSGDIVRKKLSGIQSVIAKRMHESKTNAPHFYVKTSCCVDALLELKSKFKDRGIATTVTHWLISIVAKALQKYPNINAEFIDGEIHQHKHSDIALAMSVGEMLITPIIRAAETKTIESISNETHALIDKARKHELSVQDYQNGSFTISNVGMYGIDECVSIINPPQVAILGVGAFKTELALGCNNDIVQKKMIVLTLSVDHRVINGSYACEFLQKIKQMVEDPLMMM